MTTNGAPNDLLSNFNSICSEPHSARHSSQSLPLTPLPWLPAVIVLVPILNYGIYPLLRKHKINFSPIRRILCVMRHLVHSLPSTAAAG